MSLVSFISRRSPALLGVIALAAMLSGGFNAGLIAVVNLALQGPRSTASSLLGQTIAGPGPLATAFLLLGLGKLATSTASQLLLACFSQQTVAELRNDLVHTVLQVELRTMERLGPARITATLSEDVTYVAAGLQGVPALAVNAAQVAGGAIYLAWLSCKVLLAMGGLLLVGAVVYRWLLRAAFMHLQRAREHQDELYEMFRALTLGIKELKLHAGRRRAFESHLAEEVTGAYSTCTTRAESHLVLAASWNNLLFYLLIGGLLLASPLLGSAPTSTLSGFILTALYLMGPVGALVASFSYMERAVIAFNRIQALHQLLEDATELPHGAPAPSVQAAPSPPTAHGFGHIELRGVTHTYCAAPGDRAFALGPVDVSFFAGEIVFVVGGNGSGKSTLARLVCGLYAPDAGDIFVDGQRIDEQGWERYRQLFATVFCDFYLFDRLLGIEGASGGEVAHYLHRLALNTKVRLVDSRLSTTALSTGQRKRLALLVAYLEDRPFYIFDEWAADQDPDFKQVFYRELLPELKARGKTVLVISHDERFFDAADRVIVLRDGQLAPSAPHPLRPGQPAADPDVPPAAYYRTS
jgi:putative pyoverdin transport system ATP-binding/permease protein